MLKAIIVDDEEKSRNMLASLINEFCNNVTIAGTAGNVTDALLLIDAAKPDIVFLDVEMQRETGFDLLEKISTINFEIIFTTAYEQYALRAIKFCAIDYLLKPIDLEELKAAIEKVLQRHKKMDTNQSLKALIHNLRNNNNDHQIGLSTNDGINFINVSNILYCKSDGPYTIFNLKSKETIMTSKNLKEYEDLLVNHNFFRVHRSYLINVSEMKKYIRGEGGHVIMSDGTAIDVAKRKKEEFLNKINMR